MANGDVLVPSTGGQMVIKLLDATSGGVADNGQWVSTAEFDTANIIVTGPATTTTVEVDGANDLAIPANNTHGAPLGVTTAGAPGSVVSLALPRWIKARILATGTGTVTAIAQFRRA